MRFDAPHGPRNPYAPHGNFTAIQLTARDLADLQPGEYLPCPAEIRAACVAIQATWPYIDMRVGREPGSVDFPRNPVDRFAKIRKFRPAAASKDQQYRKRLESIRKRKGMG